MSKFTMNRRDFLKVAAFGGTALAGMQVIQRVQASGSAPSGGQQWALVIDQSKCIGCGYCMMACRAHNDVSPDITWNPVLEAGQSGDKKVYLPRPCMQCANAPCVDVCPVKASTYRPDGIVMIDYDRCIGCRYCQVACPYGARSFNWKPFTGDNPAVPEWGEAEVPRRPRGVVEKCTFCYNRIDRGLELGLTPGVDLDATPACVNVCPTGARVFGDLNDPLSPASLLLEARTSYRLRDDLGTAGRVYYLPADAKDM
jgi:phenylacetyl-CoA:acceptor oxidoreductase 27-kDa subunit